MTTATRKRGRRAEDQVEPIQEARAADFLEAFDQGTALAEAQIDRAQNVITNVTLCGTRSKNGRTYTAKALADAVRLYAGAPFYLDHPTKRELSEREGVRSVLDLAGEIRNPRIAGDKVRGDLHLLDREPVKSLVFALAEQMPHRAGMSHRARGVVRPSPTGDVVESLEAVQAVELVTDPATTAGLFESVHTEEPMDFKTITLAQLAKERPDLVKAISEAAADEEEVTRLRQENEKLTEQATQRAAADAKRALQTIADKLVAEAKLPETLLTDGFKAQLAAAPDEAAVKALIEDRKALIGIVKPKAGPARSAERTVIEQRTTTQATPVELDEAKLPDTARKLGLKLVSA